MPDVLYKIEENSANIYSCVYFSFEYLPRVAIMSLLESVIDSTFDPITFDISCELRKNETI